MNLKKSLMIIVVSVGSLNAKALIKDKELTLVNNSDVKTNWTVKSTQAGCCDWNHNCSMEVAPHTTEMFEFSKYVSKSMPCWAPCIAKVVVDVYEPGNTITVTVDENGESFDATKEYVEEAMKKGSEYGADVGAVAEAAGIEEANEGVGKVAGAFVGAFTGSGAGAGNAIQVECFSKKFTLNKVKVGTNYTYQIDVE